MPPRSDAPHTQVHRLSRAPARTHAGPPRAGHRRSALRR